jgi:tetratricopeptide (TPR) repeat protein
MNRRSNNPSSFLQGKVTQSQVRRVITAGLFAILPMMAAADPFDAGQAAFKRGDFETAVSSFEQALQAGQKPGAAAYNLGAAHYRLGDYDAAEDAFLRASNDPQFAPLAFYNLGLVAKKRNDDREARIWFNQAKYHKDASKQLRGLAGKALKSLTVTPVAARRIVRPQEPKLSDHLRVSMQTGYGSDSNVYRSPSEAYVDLGDPTTPTLDPIVQSGTYVPLDVTSEIRWGLREDSHFKVHYDFSGRFYTDEELNNADEMVHRVHVGGVLSQSTPRGSRYWSSRFVVEHYEQDAYDRDTGEPQLIGAEDISNRLNYTKLGPRIYYDRRVGRFGWGTNASAYIRNYDETLDYLDLTQEQYQAGLHFSYRPWRGATIRLRGDASKRMYASRVAKDATGIRFTNNDLLEYDYATAGISFKQRLARGISATADFRYTERTDVFAAYDDYDRYSGRLSLDVRRGRLNAYAAYSYRTYDFPNAYIFDDPTLELRTLDSTFATLEADYHFTDHFGVYALVEMDLVESNDPRSQYDRTLASLSLRWRL